MSGETLTTICGNLTDAPELRFTPSGAAVASFTIASTPRTFDKASGEWRDGEPLFMRCSLWRQAGENAAESLTRGMRVIAAGTLRQRSYETKQGEKRTVVELDVEEIGPSLKYATAKVAKASRPGGNGSAQRDGGNGQQRGSGGGQGRGQGQGQSSGGWGGGQDQQSNSGGWSSGNDGGWSGSNSDEVPF